MNKYLIIIEHGESCFGAYSPDFPGCIATGKTQEEAEARMLNALQGHIQYLIESGQPVPVPTTTAAYMVALPIQASTHSAA